MTDPATLARALLAALSEEIVPICDICDEPEDQDPTNGREYDWNGETGCHRSCEASAAD